MAFAGISLSNKHTFQSLITLINIRLQPFNLDRCDERTLYIPISIEKENNRSACDLIYLIDKQDLYGAISLNERYDAARDFFLKHFNYELLYSDEQHIAKIVSDSKQFKTYLKKYADVYPKYVQPKFFN